MRRWLWVLLGGLLCLGACGGGDEEEGPSAAGEACQLDTDCEEYLLCIDGACAKTVCDKGVETGQNLCPETETCRAAIKASRGFCPRICNEDRDLCAAPQCLLFPNVEMLNVACEDPEQVCARLDGWNYVCRDPGEDGACSEDAHCEEGQTCDEFEHTCG